MSRKNEMVTINMPAISISGANDVEVEEVVEYEEEYDRRPDIFERIGLWVKKRRKRIDDEETERGIGQACEFLFDVTSHSKVVRKVSEEMGVLIAKYKSISAFMEDGEEKTIMDLNIASYENVHGRLIECSKDAMNLEVTMQKNGIIV